MSEVDLTNVLPLDGFTPCIYQIEKNGSWFPGVIINGGPRGIVSMDGTIIRHYNSFNTKVILSPVELKQLEDKYWDYYRLGIPNR